MRRINRRTALGMMATAVGMAALRPVVGKRVAWAGEAPRVDARVVAINIPGASAVAPVGTFLAGGPIHDNPTFAAFTLPGAVLDPRRILVGARSNFGAPLADEVGEPGALLSIDPSGSDILNVSQTFASSGVQASSLGGRVQMYSANSPFWRNNVYNPGAVTGPYTGVSSPLGLSINNAFGRLWPANSPFGQNGFGSSSILDPDGRPLKGAPNPVTGGVYVGNLTPRQPAQIIPGALSTGAVGTAFLGRSPDGSGRAVFCVITADGAIVQEHTAKALDGLAPAGTVQPLLGQGWHGANHDIKPRLGAIVNYTPVLKLFVSEPFNNTIAVLDLIVTGPAGNQVFAPGSITTISSDALNQPVDLAPSHIETEDPNWSSNTTLEEEADFYVANRGNNTIVRMRQDGTVAAIVRMRVDGHSLGNAHLNGIATSSDGTKIYVTFTGKLPGPSNEQGGVLELPAFGG